MIANRRRTGSEINIKDKKMKNFMTLAAFAAAGILTVSSCCREADVAGEWTVNEVDGKSLPSLEEGQKVPFLNFDPSEGRLHGFTGVNIINSTYTLDGKDIEIGQAMSTMMAGPQEWMDTERDILNALDRVKTVKSPSEGTLELCDSTGSAVIVLVRPAEGSAQAD